MASFCQASNGGDGPVPGPVGSTSDVFHRRHLHGFAASIGDLESPWTTTTATKATTGKDDADDDADADDSLSLRMLDDACDQAYPKIMPFFFGHLSWNNMKQWHLFSSKSSQKKSGLQVFRILGLIWVQVLKEKPAAVGFFISAKLASNSCTSSVASVHKNPQLPNFGIKRSHPKKRPDLLGAAVASTVMRTTIDTSLVFFWHHGTMSIFKRILGSPCTSWH